MMYWHGDRGKLVAKSARLGETLAACMLIGVPVEYGAAGTDGGVTCSS